MFAKNCPSLVALLVAHSSCSAARLQAQLGAMAFCTAAKFIVSESHRLAIGFELDLMVPIASLLHETLLLSVSNSSCSIWTNAYIGLVS
jgi:hypothetical protein